ncbi:MAG: LysM peptidoglycan-binding domain-containing protein, partial [Abditibacteriales bacterium]|nr:LysM peptidoglycan-binding domain-containing protein [Abditibacteriales bacterium]MDW8368584.1 LysM domain-containing protein [Abditibacteriales bacterium]
MPHHTVQPGECLATIAARYNFTNYRTIYEHPRNAQLRQNRKNPNMLVPGDRVFVPPPEQRDESRST